MDIKIENYLSHQEVREIVQDELRNQIRSLFSGSEDNTQRLLSNLAYSVVMEEVDKISPNYQDKLINKVVELINNKDISFHLFNYDHFSGAPKSFAAKTIEQTVKENQQLIKDKVIQTIKEADYSEQALLKFENLADEFSSNIYDFVELMRSKNNGR